VIVEVGSAREKEPTKPPPIVVKIDRPFIFFIRDIKTNTILFVGREMNPAQ
jgi:serine protease inhibitor